MDKTRAKVYFSATTEEYFDTNIITEELKVSPTSTWQVGDTIPNKPLKRKETSWEFSTEYEETFDINEQLKKVSVILEGKEKILKDLKRTHDLDYMFMIVIIMENGETPTTYLEKNFIKFLAKIDANVDVDLYANPYEDDMEEWLNT